MRTTIVTLVLLALAACTSPVNTAEPAHSGATPQEQWIDKIEKSSTLADKVNVVSAYVGESGGNRRVQLNVKNGGNYPQDLRYRFEWFDGQGFKLYNPTEGWTNLTLRAGEQASLQATAPSPDAVDWRFTVQDWDRK